MENNKQAIYNQRFSKIMQSQFQKKVVEKHSEYIKYYMDEKCTHIWYAVLYNFSGDQDEFNGGEYIVRIIAPPEFPLEPPHFYFMTPNGIYDCEVKVCVSIGEYHKNSYIPTLGMSGFTESLLSGMIGWKTLGNGMNIISDKNKQIISTLAKVSHKYNEKHHGELLSKINKCYGEYSKKSANK